VKERHLIHACVIRLLSSAHEGYLKALGSALPHRSCERRSCWSSIKYGGEHDLIASDH